MAEFRNKNFGVSMYVNGFTWWVYRDNANTKDMSADGFFDPVYTLLAIGDVITLVGNNTTDNYYIKSIKPTVLKRLGEE